MQIYSAKHCTDAQGPLVLPSVRCPHTHLPVLTKIMSSQMVISFLKRSSRSSAGNCKIRLKNDNAQACKDKVCVL